MKIAVAGFGDPEVIGTWSGIPANIVAGLKKNGHNVISINLTKPKEPWYYNWLRRIYWRTIKKWFLAEVEEIWLKAVSQQLDIAIEKSQPEAVVVIHADFLAYTTFAQPVCFIHDATFEQLVDYYVDFSNLTARSVKNGNKMYQKALARTTAAVFSSTWASNSAINYYDTPKSKIYTIPFGANLAYIPDFADVQSWVMERSRSQCCHIIFLGINWERKGGPDCLKFIIELNRLGMDCHLTIVGCTPQIPENLENYVTKTGFLRKEVTTEATVMETLFRRSHLLILPSLAECYGCVYCEANAYGIPVIGRDTGGIPEIIKEGINGLLLKKGEAIESLAKQWNAIWENQELYTQLSLSARKEYDERLNYSIFTNKLESILANFNKK